MGSYGHGSWLAVIPFLAIIVMRMLSVRRRQAPGQAPMGFRDQHHDPGTHRYPPHSAPGPAPSHPGGTAEPRPPASSGIGTSGLAAGWFPDPTGRYEQRYWSGSAWTEHVSRGGVPATDEPPPSLRGGSPTDGSS